MGLLDTTIELAKFAGKLANPELVEMAYKANIEALEVSKTNLELQKKVAELEGQVKELQTTQDLEKEVFREHGLVFRKGDKEPCCSHCWDAQRKLIHVSIAHAQYPECPACKTLYYIEAADALFRK
jgi:hypothetical protein